MSMRALLLTWLVLCATVVQPLVVDGSAVLVAVTAAALLWALTVAGSAVPPATALVAVAVPARRRLRGRFLQQSRPGVPGRTRARAPGCGR